MVVARLEDIAGQDDIVDLRHCGGRANEAAFPRGRESYQNIQEGSAIPVKLAYLCLCFGGTLAGVT